MQNAKQEEIFIPEIDIKEEKVFIEEGLYQDSSQRESNSECQNLEKDETSIKDVTKILRRTRIRKLKFIKMASASPEPDDMDYFVKLLAEFPIVFAKSTQDVAKKRLAWKEIGKVTEMEAEKVKKKIQNATARVKKVYDRNLTGNRPIRTKPWIKSLKVLMDANETNPVPHGHLPRGLSSEDPVPKLAPSTSGTQPKKPLSVHATPCPDDDDEISTLSSGSSGKRKFEYVSDDELKLPENKLRQLYVLEKINESRVRQQLMKLQMQQLRAGLMLSSSSSSLDFNVPVLLPDTPGPTPHYINTLNSLDVEDGEENNEFS